MKHSAMPYRRRRRQWREVSLAALMSISFGCVPLGTALAEEHGAVRERGSPYYRIVRGKVDASTLLGWQIFHNACFGCHGVGAVGTEIAPDLTTRVKRLSPVEFAMTVLSRYRVIVPYREGLPADQAELKKEMEKHQHGPQGRILMPAWETDSQVKPHILDLYGYLRARADGVLGPGRPQSVATGAGK